MRNCWADSPWAKFFPHPAHRNSSPLSPSSARDGCKSESPGAAPRQHFLPSPSVPSPVANWLFGHHAAPTQRFADPYLLDCGSDVEKGGKGLRERAATEDGEQGGTAGKAVTLQSRSPGLASGCPHRGPVTGCGMTKRFPLCSAVQARRESRQGGGANQCQA